MYEELILNLTTQLFNSFFQGGFECSAHCLRSGQRLDLLESTQHYKYVNEDYNLLSSHGIKTVRDGIRWHLIEVYPGYYDWSSFLPMLQASIKNKTQVIWDLCHYGWPNHIDIWRPAFVQQFATFAQAVAKIVRSETDEVPFYSLINEISFFAWAGGDVEYLNPFFKGRGFELKHQLIRATITAIDAIRLIDPRARFVQAEPVINVINRTNNNINELNSYNEPQYETWDILSGELWPGLGGRKDLLDIIGVNYYHNNQWYIDGTRINRDNPQYMPFANILEKVYKRYHRPIFIAETGIEGDQRPEWFNYICNEIYTSIINNIPIEGVCLYPILDYPGWDDNRHCQTGLYGFADTLGYRPLCNSLAMELRQQQEKFSTLLNNVFISNQYTYPNLAHSQNNKLIIKNHGDHLNKYLADDSIA